MKKELDRQDGSLYYGNRAMPANCPVARRLDALAFASCSEGLAVELGTTIADDVSGCLAPLAIASPKKRQTASLFGWFWNAATPITRREKWSTAIATQWQNGQHCGKQEGNQVVQKPPVGTIVKSTGHR
jgi:hypothetical protein